MINFWSFRPEYKKYRKNILRIIDKSLNSGVTFFGNNLRNFEKQDKFDDEFVENARKVYKLNDERFSLKNTLNLEFDSNIKEVKSYEKY